MNMTDEVLELYSDAIQCVWFIEDKASSVHDSLIDSGPEEAEALMDDALKMRTESAKLWDRLMRLRREKLNETQR